MSALKYINVLFLSSKANRKTKKEEKQCHTKQTDGNIKSFKHLQFVVSSDSKRRPSTRNNVPSTRVSGRERHYAATIHSSQLRGSRKCQSAWLLEINTILPVRAILRADKSFPTYWLPRHLISMRRSKRDAMLRSRPSFWAEDGAGSGRRWQANRDGLMLLMSSLLPSHQHAAGFPLHGIMGAC